MRLNARRGGLFGARAPYDLDDAVRDDLDQTLDMVAEAGLYAAVAFRSGIGRNDAAIQHYDGPDADHRIWGDPAAQDAWVKMWSAAAERYRDHPAVVGYGLMVEPNAAATRQTWDPAEWQRQYGGRSQDVNVLFGRVTQGIREVDDSTPILLSPRRGAVWPGSPTCR